MGARRGSGTLPATRRSTPATCRACEASDKVADGNHTPVQDYRRSGEWVVLEYVSSDRGTAVVGFFRLADSPSGTYTFISRGLDASREYLVCFDNSGQTVKVSGLQLCTSGLAVQAGAPLTSELLVIREGRP